MKKLVVVLGAAALALAGLPLVVAVAVTASLPRLAATLGDATTGGCPGGAAGLPAEAGRAGASLAGGAPACAPGPTPASAERGVAAAAYAEAQIGTPYRWGGETAGVGFDCSGLAQAAWRAAGVSIPRVAQQQFDAGPALPAGAELEPGDLVFFGRGATEVTHVGIVVSSAGISADMVDAPHTGALVRIDSFRPLPGSGWGGDVFVGATRP